MKKTFLLIIFTLFTGTSCSTTKTKAACISECQERGTEYVGITPDGQRSGQYGEFTSDVCHCK